jgi:colicin import membrane protein
MARKLKTFQTSLGFYDLAVAAPSMKAALEAWGAESNLFHQGVAKESEEPAVVAATMSKPGVVLRRPVGSGGTFKEQAELPRLSGDDIKRSSRELGSKAKASAQAPIDDKSARKAALGFEKEQKRRESERLKEEVAREKERERRRKAIAKAQAALEKAEREHDSRMAAIEAERAALEGRSQAEDDRWEAQREKLQRALHKTRD